MSGLDLQFSRLASTTEQIPHSDCPDTGLVPAVLVKDPRLAVGRDDAAVHDKGTALSRLSRRPPDINSMISPELNDRTISTLSPK